jgi:hypothetical protein
MNNTFCLSFSDIAFQLLHVTSDDNGNLINSNHQFDYHSPKSPDQIFNSKNISFISARIGQFAEENEIENFSLSFALPFNFADIKKVAFPLQSDKTLKKKQIEWELKTTLPGELKDYKISVLNELDEQSFSSAMVVAIKKELLIHLKQIADENKSNIKNVFLNCFALENYILNDNRFGDNKNFAFLKVNKNILEYHFFGGKQYFSSQIDSLDLSSRKKEEVVLERTYERYKNILNLFEQVLNKNPFELFLYGSSLNGDILNVLKKGLSIPVEYAKIDNFPTSEDYKYIEAWGSIL